MLVTTNKGFFKVIREVDRRILRKFISKDSAMPCVPYHSSREHTMKFTSVWTPQAALKCFLKLTVHRISVYKRHLKAVAVSVGLLWKDIMKHSGWDTGNNGRSPPWKLMQSVLPILALSPGNFKNYFHKKVLSEFKRA